MLSFSFFRFPTGNQHRERMRWRQAISRSADNTHVGKLWMPHSGSYVCSRHFVDRKPTAANPYPMKDLGYTMSNSRRIHLTRPLSPEPAPKTALLKTELSVGMDSDTESDSSEVAAGIGCQTSDFNEIDEVKNRDLTIQKQRHQIKGLESQIKVLQKQNRQLKRCSAKNLLTTDDRCNFYTGITQLSVFYLLLDTIQPHIKKQVRKTILTSADKFLMVLMRLRLGLLLTDLAYRFGVSTAVVGRIWNHWLPIMARELSVLIYWPDKVQIQGAMPVRYKELPNLRAIIDCTEFFIQSPRSMTNSCATYSHYKHHNTLKVLIAIAPNGFISFVSKAYCGRASDKAITEDSGFYNLLEANDMIMADKGFQITEELEARQVTFLIPPGRRGDAQMSINKVRKTKKIANLRIYVEQIIGRLKVYQILSREMSNNMCSQIDNIIKICCAMTNLKSPMY